MAAHSHGHRHGHSHRPAQQRGHQHGHPPHHSHGWRRGEGDLTHFEPLPVPFLVLLALLVLALVLLVAVPTAMGFAPIALLVVLGGFQLCRPHYLVFSTLAVVGTVVSGYLVRDVKDAVAIPSILSIAATAVVVGRHLRSRFALGLRGDGAEDLLLEMRRRLTASTHLPDLPEPWRIEAHLAAAYGQSFGGDVVVSSLGPRRFQVAIVDVSGNGLVAAARSTQLTGALGALIGSVPSEEFVSRANDYVIRQGWDDGFATLVHLSVDLASGHYTLSRAGHPAPLVREAEEWSVLEGASSMPLGVVPGAAFHRLAGRLQPGDGFVLFSDGLVESREVPSQEGTRRLLDIVRRATEPSFDGAAGRLASGAPSPEEDRTVVCVWRAPEAR